MVTLLFKRIGQPLVLGYLIAGFLVGPEASFLPTVQDREAIRVWAEIGVIVLLFGLGLEFSFKKLAAVGRGASITAIVEILSMLGVGFLVGKMFGWKTMDCIFLGGILSISSTTIIIKAFDELGFKQRGFVSLVFGVLVVEDLVAILLMVLLSTIALSNEFQGLELLSSAVRLLFFLTLWFLGGIFLLPWFLRRVRPLMNDETSLVVSLGLCLMMVLLATVSGFSPALGAFVMGSILAETPDGERIEHNLKPVKDLFAAVFFVSVGMLIEVHTLYEHWFAILCITLATVFGKLISTSVGALLAGRSLKHSVQAGMSLAQIGEFSFIIATLGLSLKVTSGFLYPIAVAVSAITTFITPYLIRSADSTYALIDRTMPQVWRERLEQRGPDVSPLPEDRSQAMALRLFINAIVVIAIALASSHWLYPLVVDRLGEGAIWRYTTLFAAILTALPFLWAVVAKPDKWRSHGYAFEDLKQVTSRAVLSLLGRSLLAVVLVGVIVSQFTSAGVSVLLVSASTLTVGLLGVRNFTKIYDRLETRFLGHLNEREIEQLKSQKQKPTLAPWDAHLAEIEVHPDSSVVGKSLSELALRETLGVTLALIERGSRQIVAPRRDMVLMAFDRVSAIGTDEQLAGLSKLLQATTVAPVESDIHYGLNYLTLDEGSSFVGKTIRESGLREATDGLVVGIEREDRRILNPDSLIELRVGDGLWIVGNQQLIAKL